MDIANKRWIVTDKLLKGFQKEQRLITDDLKTELKDFLNSLDITLYDLNKPISKRENEKLNKTIRDNRILIKKDNYTLYKVYTKKQTPLYSEYAEIMLLIIYLQYMDRTYQKAKKYFKAVSKDAVKQAEEEVGRPPRVPFSITMDLIESLLIVNTLQKPLWDYLTLLVQSCEEEAYKLLLLRLQSSGRARNDAYTREDVDELAEKQRRRIVYIHDGRESGIMTDIFRDLWHEMYIEPYREENLQVRFIAEVDNATTPMCLSMANMLFYINDWNEFRRYCADIDGMATYRVFGLVQGINLPPIMNHFHWCRSTVTYQIDNIFNTTL